MYILIFLLKDKIDTRDIDYFSIIVLQYGLLFFFFGFEFKYLGFGLKFVGFRIDEFFFSVLVELTFNRIFGKPAQNSIGFDRMLQASDLEEATLVDLGTPGYSLQSCALLLMLPYNVSVASVNRCFFVLIERFPMLINVF